KPTGDVGAPGKRTKRRCGPAESADRPVATECPPVARPRGETHTPSVRENLARRRRICERGEDATSTSDASATPRNGTDAGPRGGPDRGGDWRVPLGQRQARPQGKRRPPRQRQR